MNKHAIQIANKELYARHPELKGRLLTMASADAAYRQEWMRYYKAVDEADKKAFGKCKVGSVVKACAAKKIKGWDQREVLKILCNPQDQWAVNVLANPNAKTTRIGRILYVDKKFNLDASGNPVGDPIEVNVFEAGGSNNAARHEINIVASVSNEEAAAIIVHEARHQVQDKTQLNTWKEQEVDAYRVGEEFRIKKGLPEHAPGFRTQDTTGKIIPDIKAIEAFVNQEYPVDPAWLPGEEITEAVEDLSTGWDCTKVSKP